MRKAIITFDGSAKIFEIWTKDGEWIGCADTYNEAILIAERYEA